VWAQNSSTTDREIIRQLVEQVKQLQQQEHELQERIGILEGKQAPGMSSPEAQPAPPQQQTEEETPSAQTPFPAPHDWHDQHGLHWRGFGEADYKVLNQRQPELGTYGFTSGSAGNFYTGDFGLFLTSRMTEKASMLAEMIFEEEDAQRYRVNLRRLLLKYDYNDHLKMAFGRYQTDIGYYNWEFQSAAWLQTTADRPLIMEYATNGGLLPTQAVGVSITGAVPSGKLGLHYIGEYGSSDTIRPDINGDGQVTDENNGNHVNIGVYLQPDALPGLQIGSSFYHDKISNFQQGPSIRYGQGVVNGYVVYVARGIEFLNEGFLIRDAALHFNTVFNTPAFYSQISRSFGPVRPFFRFQYVNASSNNLIYNDVDLREGPSYGVRYDLNDYIAFKAQLDQTIRRSLPNLDGLHLQLAFTF
jgi:hypothetical protein